METNENQSTDFSEMPKYEVYSSSIVVKKATDRIVQLSQDVASSFIGIGRELSNLSKNPTALRDCGYEDVFDYGEKVFGFKTTSCRNMIGVYERFGGNGGAIQGKYRDYSFTQLVELLPVEDVKDYEPDMTVKEIRDKKILDKAARERTGLADYLQSAIVRMLDGLGLTDAKAKPVKDIPSWSRVDYRFDCEAKDGKEDVTLTVDFTLPSTLEASDMYYGDSYRYQLNSSKMKSFAEMQKEIASQIDAERKEASKEDADEEEGPEKPEEYESDVDHIDEIRKWMGMSDAEQAEAVSLENILEGYREDGKEESLPFFLCDSYSLYLDNAGIGMVTSSELDANFPVSLAAAGVDDAGCWGAVTDKMWLRKASGKLSAITERDALDLIRRWCREQISIDDSAREAWERGKAE